jgi:hypothetical protein
MEVGTTPYGVRRRIPITGGEFRGPRISGAVLAGGADWQLQRGDNYVVLEADYMLRADDGTLIHVHNVGLSNSRVPGAAKRTIRTAPVFEAPAGAHAWLNQSIFVGTLQPIVGADPAVRLRFYGVT